MRGKAVWILLESNFYLNESRNKDIEEVVSTEGHSEADEVVLDDAKDVHLEAAVVREVRVLAAQWPVGQTLHR